jgi:hypothetical protein
MKNARENTIPDKERAVVLSKTPINAVVSAGYPFNVFKFSERIERV